MPVIRLRDAADLEQWRLLTTPEGEPQSGRVRYAAAMYFHQRGAIDDAMLESYRILCKRDHESPPPPMMIIADCAREAEKRNRET